MKKNLLILGAAVLLAAGAQAQTSYGLKAGVNIPKLSYSGNGMSVSTKSATNFYITGFADLPVSSSFSIQPGISLQGKGGKYTDEKPEKPSESKTDLMYLEVPVNAVYYVPAGSGKVFIGAGPYVGYGISGENKIAGIKSDVNWGSEKQFKRFDFGVNTMLGYKLENGFLINAGYGFGLTDIGGDLSLAKTKNNVLSFGVGFQF